MVTWSSAVAPRLASRPARNTRTLTWWLLLLLVWIVSALYSAGLLKRGWFPHDEGTIGQSAERVLEGQLPHRDFDDVYTGGLSYLNAAALRIFGENLLSPRIVLFLCFLGWIPVVYWIASRCASVLGAAAITLLAAAWSIPSYSAAIPSWYNLFFATFGAAAVLCYLDKERPGWLFVAGLCGGISFLFKVSGVYFIAAILLFFVFREQDGTSTIATRGRRWAYSALIVSGLLAFIAGLLAMLRREASIVSGVEFFLPPAAIAGLCIWREVTASPVPGSQRLKRLLRMLIPFVGGVCLPILLFLVPYIHAHAVSQFIYGVFILPARRFAFAARRPAGFPLYKLAATVVLVAILIVGYFSRPRSLVLRVTLILYLIAMFLASKTYARAFVAIWAPLPLLVPLAVLIAILVLRYCDISPIRRQELVLLLSVAALCSLIQFPFSAGIYFNYAAPLLALALAALFSTGLQRSQFILGSVVVFYLAFVVFRLTPGFVYYMGNFYQQDMLTTPLHLPRAAGLRVRADEAQQYDSLIPVVERHAGTDAFIYAGPDCPEVYFLSGKRNPTPTLFDFFDEPEGHDQRILQAIDSHQVNVVAISLNPPFSPPISSYLSQALEERFPNSTQIGKFEVRWRGSSR